MENIKEAKPLTIYKNWKDMLANICKSRGYIQDKNCRIKYEASIDTTKNNIQYTAYIYPFDCIEEIALVCTVDEDN